MSILVGTASWAARSLLDCGEFYPPEVNTPEARLNFYADQFPLVEVDSSYYALPQPALARGWAAHTPARFTFNVKAFRLFTGHGASPRVLPADLRAALGATARRVMLGDRDLPAEVRDELWSRFIDALEPLADAGKLGAVHFQFAPWVLDDRDGRARVEQCASRLRGWPMAVEFRHRGWFEGDAARRGTLAWLRGLGAVHTVVDCPHRAVGGSRNTVPAVWEVTDPRLAVVRLHGRNAGNWRGARRPPGDGRALVGGRFDYDYSDAELHELAPRIEGLAQQAQRVHVVFNNNHDSQGQRNARTLGRILERRAGSR